ncbi:hypothetical protein CGMCC3_g5517 [Colletotrichum fructicola]|nr:uncharacterized protein CGMCC3_g5517 [Colletotrichum fructicola]KAE9578373.1 hypothetical protein CGMCC3_g5517 [Colletotrichum fructicola]
MVGLKAVCTGRTAYSPKDQPSRMQIILSEWTVDLSGTTHLETLSIIPPTLNSTTDSSCERMARHDLTHVALWMMSTPSSTVATPSPPSLVFRWPPSTLRASCSASMNAKLDKFMQLAG